MRARARLGLILTAIVMAAPIGAPAQTTPDAPAGRPAAIVNLATEQIIVLCLLIFEPINGSPHNSNRH